MNCSPGTSGFDRDHAANETFPVTFLRNARKASSLNLNHKAPVLNIAYCDGSVRSVHVKLNSNPFAAIPDTLFDPYHPNFQFLSY
jgi:prepilin-type processing-associated H-X9-DG protein